MFAFQERFRVELTVVVLRTTFRAATLKGAVRIADVANIVPGRRMRPRQMIDRSYSRGERRIVLVGGEFRECRNQESQ